MPRNTVKKGLTPYRTRAGEVFTGGRREFRIDNGYATALGEGDPVLVSAVYVTRAANTTAGVTGVFAGCKYVDPVTKQPVESTYYPGNLTSGGVIEGNEDILAYVYMASDLTFFAKAAGAIAATGAGTLHAVTIGTPSTFTKRSEAVIATAVSSTPGTDVQVQILSFPNIAGTLPGDNPTVVEVTLVSPKIV